MKFRLVLASAVVVMSLAAIFSGAEVPLATHRTPTGEMEFQYPSSLTLRTEEGKSCIDGACHPIEDFRLIGSEPDHAKKSVVQFSIQRGINPKKLPMKALYETMANRSLNPALEKEIIIGGKPAIRRRGSVSVYSAKAKVGEKVTVGAGQGSKSYQMDDTTYVLLNLTDMLAIHNKAPNTSFDETFDKILSTLQFRQ